MGWFGFGGKDWNVIAVMYERADIYRVNGNRAKGKAATSTLSGAKKHNRTIFYAVFDQNRSLVESGPGGGAKLVPDDVLKRLERELLGIGAVSSILDSLETGEHEKAAKKMDWRGYPPA